jgi:hypothetical protein
MVPSTKALSAHLATQPILDRKSRPRTDSNGATRCTSRFQARVKSFSRRVRKRLLTKSPLSHEEVHSQSLPSFAN